MIDQIKLNINNKVKRKYLPILFFAIFSMLIPTIYGHSTLTIINQTKATTNDLNGRNFSPDDLYVVFLGDFFSPMEAVSLATPLQRVLVSTPKTTVNIPSYATRMQIRSLQHAEKRAFASTDFIPITQSKNGEIKISGPIKQANREELLIQPQISWKK